MLEKNIRRADLNDIHHILLDFVQEAEQLYGVNIMLSGMHELLHLVQCTKDFGPIKGVSAFQFEEMNRGLVSLIDGKDLVGDEFLKVFSVAQALKTYVEKFVVNNNIKSFIRKFSALEPAITKLQKLKKYCCAIN